MTAPVVTQLLYTIDEAAKALSLSSWTLRSHRKRGTISTVKIGRSVRIKASEIERIANEGLVSLAATPLAQKAA
jgi:excisionase family DNA binding protein